jgi:phosphotransferase system enzyme I (PtsP)
VILHEPRIVVTELLNDDIDAELKRLDDALGSLRISIDDMLSRRDVSMEGEHRAVLEAYRMFAHDRGWVRKLEEAIRNGLTSEAAVEKVQSDTRARMIHMTDPYLRERLHDFDDLANRLLRQLTGFVPGGSGLPQDAIIVARAMGAAELLDYPREAIRGLVLEDGAVTSHVVIVARAMGIPVVGQAIGAPSLAENRDPIIVDGEDGTVHLRPLADLQSAYADKVRFRAKRQEQFRALRDVEPRTRDGQNIMLQMNAGLLVDLPQLAESGASGIGLFRTELQFMIASTMPKVDEQEKLYRNVLRQAGDRPVTFRTLDIGGDKVVPYFRSAEEENPALGGGRSVSRWTGPVCCGPSFERF